MILLVGPGRPRRRRARGLPGARLPRRLRARWRSGRRRSTTPRACPSSSRARSRSRRRGEPGPVVVALPEDMLTRRGRRARRARRTGRSPPRRRATRRLARLAELLARRRRPLAIVGEGGWTAQAGADVAAFAEAQRIPVAASFRCQDYVDNALARLRRARGARRWTRRSRQRIREADVLLAIGGRLGEIPTDGYTLARRPGGRASASSTCIPTRTSSAPSTSPSWRSSAGLEAFAAAARALAPAGADAGAGCSRRRAPSTSATCRGHASSPARCRCPRSWRCCASGSGPTRSSPTAPATSRVWAHRYYEFRRYGTQLAPAQRLDGLRRPGRGRGEGRAPGARRGLPGRRRRLPDDRPGARDRGPGGAADRRARGQQRDVRDDPHAPGAPLPGARRSAPTCATPTSPPTRARSGRTARWSSARRTSRRARRGAGGGRARRAARRSAGDHAAPDAGRDPGGRGERRE